MTLKKEPYAVMVSGEKKEEFRLKSKWVEGRLICSKTGRDKRYSRVKFVNGYGKTKPSFTVSFKGYKLEANGVYREYSNGLVVNTRGKPTYVISLGDDVTV